MYNQMSAYSSDHKTDPAYLKLYHMLRDDIIQGIYPTGSRIPSKRTIASDTGYSVITVAHALELLCDEGYLESRQRSGSFVIYREADFQSVPEVAGRCNVQESVGGGMQKSVGSGDMSGTSGVHSATSAAWDMSVSSGAAGAYRGDFPFSVLAKTMRRVLSTYGRQILVKGHNQGCGELRGEICRYLARSRSMHVCEEQIILGAGAEYLYGLLVQLFDAPRRFAIESPSYEKIQNVYESLGVSCDLLPLSHEGIPTDVLNQTDAMILHVTPFHSYPTGITVGISKKKEYLNWAWKNHAYIVEDNYDSELTISRKTEESLFSMSDHDNVIYLNTFSRTIAPSMRLGYMILPASLVSRFQEKLGFYSCTVPLFEQYVLAELLRSGDYERNLNRVRRKIRLQNQRRQITAPHTADPSGR